VQPNETPTGPLRQLPGFIAGLLIILVAGVALHLLGRAVAGDRPSSRYTVLAITFLLSFGAFLFLERNFWLSRLMGLRHGKSHVVEAAFFTVLSIVWAFVRAAGTDPEEPETGEAAGKEKAPAHPRDPARESVETIVFVVVLVLLLKLFVTEAFVIPTGSMAETLYGYQTIVKCEQCGHEFPVNSHDEVEPGQDGEMRYLVGYSCPNCRYTGWIDPRSPSRPTPRTGDRVLVLKPLYHVSNPNRGDVVVFKYPKEPQIKHTAQNYIKRCMGFERETIAIHRGELFVANIQYPKGDEDDPTYPLPQNPLDLWQERYMYRDNPIATAGFEDSRKAGFPENVHGGFRIVRKTDEQVLACRRIVWDNDEQPAALAGKVPPRWYAPPEAADKWTGDNPDQPRYFAHTDAGEHWLRYRHLVWHPTYPRLWAWDDLRGTGDEKHPTDPEPPTGPVAGPIDNFLGYNSGFELPKRQRGELVIRPGPIPHPWWTHEEIRKYNQIQQDLFDKLPEDQKRAQGGPVRFGLPASTRAVPDPQWVGDLILECEAELGDGAAVTLELSKGANRFQARFADGQVTLSRTGPGEQTFGSRPCRVKKGTYVIRLANVDCRLRVWVDDRAIDFGTDADYPHPEPGSGENVKGEGLTQENDVAAPAGIAAKGAVTVRHVRLHRDIYYTRTSETRGNNPTGADIYYVQPGHYLCLGDNSAQSSDSRAWGLVPERLMLGKAVFVFWPAWPDNRVGFIK
jgi:signal peptidase I